MYGLNLDCPLNDFIMADVYLVRMMKNILKLAEEENSIGNYSSSANRCIQWLKAYEIILPKYKKDTSINSNFHRSPMEDPESIQYEWIIKHISVHNFDKVMKIYHSGRALISSKKVFNLVQNINENFEQNSDRWDVFVNLNDVKKVDGIRQSMRRHKLITNVNRLVKKTLLINKRINDTKLINYLSRYT